MTSSRRNKLAAAAVFLLIAGGVLGGMAWATRSSFQLAEQTITEEHRRKISAAVWELSNFMQGILNTETARDTNDYVAYHKAQPVAVGSDANVDLDPNWVVLRSPLMDGPPHPWIDLNFHVTPDGKISSPQVFDEAALSPWDHTYPYVPSRRARETLQWLRRELPRLDLHAKVAMVCKSENAAGLVESADETSGPTTRTSPTAGTTKAGRRKVSRGFRDRQQSLQESQDRYLPREACVDADIAEWNLRNLAGSTQGILQAQAPGSVGQVGIVPDPFTAFWFGVGPDGYSKLAFVRECHADDAVFYQGFVGDWGRLKPKLLAEIEELYPEAELEPVLDAERDQADARGMELMNLPVRLVVPEIPGGASAAAWRDVRGTLVTSWAAGLAVLVIAGWGLRNLVALTERRMQFAYAVTHELRTPLTTFRLYSDMLSAGLVPDAARQEYLDTLNTESQRLSSLVEEVLEYARLENHKVKLNPADTDGASLLSLISQTLEERCEANGIEAVTENTLADGQRVRTDVDLVNRIAGVLVNNACRHVRGRDSARVLVRLGGQDERIQIDVVDSGPGIERADSRAIFKPFRRGRGEAAAPGGVGLGLALARGWAKLLGGRLELAARHDARFGGAHFRLTIPTQPPQ